MRNVIYQREVKPFPLKNRLLLSIKLGVELQKNRESNRQEKSWLLRRVAL